MKKYCVISAVGKQSLHHEWMNKSQNFDLHLIVYDDSFNEFLNDSPFVTHCKGFKLKLVHDYLAKHPQFLNQYEYFFMPDDDIRIDSANIELLFKHMQSYSLEIAQPALSDSYYTYEHTMKCKSTVLRYTNFVEMMAPCFSQTALRKVLFTFNENTNGWGSEYHWNELIGFTGCEMAIIDDIVTIHTRPVQSYSEQNSIELKSYLAKYNLKTEIKHYGSIPNENFKFSVSKEWNPIFSDDSGYSFFEIRLNKIARILLQNINSIQNPGLLEGRTGISLFLLSYYKLTGKRKFLDIGLALFESVNEKLELSINDYTFATGLPGISWYVEYLAQHNYIENETDDILDEICRQLNHVDYCEISDMDLSKGLLGYAMHFLSRMKNPDFKLKTDIHQREKEISSHIIDLFEVYLVKLIGNNSAAFSENNIIAGVILFLCQLNKLHFQNEKIRPILQEFVNYCRKIKSTNRSSELYNAHSLFLASKVLIDKDLEIRSIDMALKMLEENKTGIFNENMWTIHLYNHFYQNTSIEAFKNAVLYRISITFNQNNTGNQSIQIPFFGTNESKADLSILNGLTGMGLVLISAMADYKPEWDNCLLLS